MPSGTSQSAIGHRDVSPRPLDTRYWAELGLPETRSAAASKCFGCNDLPCGQASAQTVDLMAAAGTPRIACAAIRLLLQKEIRDS